MLILATVAVLALIAAVYLVRTATRHDDLDRELRDLIRKEGRNS